MNSNIENYSLIDEEDNFDIAITGMAGRFPGAENIDQYWQNLCAAKESITFFSDEELIDAGVDSEVLKAVNYVKASPMIGDPSLFDAKFFGYSPREAIYTDPQHRIFLECAFEALAHAGCDPDTFDGRIGVYGGASMNTYLLLSGLFSNYFNEQLPVLIGNDKDFLTTRVSYKLNLKGPSITVQTACSTSLVAIHLACQSLLNSECDMALAGGVTVRLPQKAGYFYQEGNIVSPDGHCRAFDAKSQGTIFGSGAGIIVLKRLIDAIADGDCIHAVIKGSAINNDGSSKVDYTAPSVNSQAEDILQAMANSGVEADSISYIEAHGTGTALGDPIEIAALTNAFRAFTDKKGYCAIGSVKSNIGHLDSAAGVASLIKTALALKYKQIPPSLHFENPNPEIDFENSPFYVNTELSEWKSNDYPRRAGVNSLGVGGTNAHVVLEEAPPVELSSKSRSQQLLFLSAKTPLALDAATTNLVGHLKQYPDINLADAAYTLKVGRKGFDHRRMIVCGDVEEAITTIETADASRMLNDHNAIKDPSIAFMFSGQGSQYVNMGLELYKTEPLFKEQIDLCAEVLQPYLELDLRDILYPDDMQTSQNMLTQTRITQPALFTVEYALAQLWLSWGIQPVAMVGHSIGEYVAACLAGIFTLNDALTLVAARGRLVQDLPAGSMLAVSLSEEDIETYLGNSLSLAAVNAPSLCVVSGKTEAVEKVENQLTQKNVGCRRLHTSHAFHSEMMEPVLVAFAEQVSQIQMAAPEKPVLSNVTGTWMTADEATDPDYWVRHLRRTVRFADCVTELIKEPDRLLLEIGPGNTLSILAKQCAGKAKANLTFSSMRHPQEKTSDVSFLMTTLGKLWLSGILPDWTAFYANEKRHRLSLPAYPFERKRYWFGEEKLHAASIFSAPEKTPAEFKVPGTIQSDDESRPTNKNEKYMNDVEITVADIWKEILGIKQIDVNDDYFELGGSSLMAVSLFDRIAQKFGKILPLATLYEAPTVRQLSNLLTQKDFNPSWSSLVKMQSNGSKLPFFCVHAAGGNILMYHHLALYLGSDQPFYGLQSRGLDGDQSFDTRIEEMAARYIKEIQTVQPEGPYLLGGYCLGGTVALEMAQQLKAEGKEVGMLALFETYNWSKLKPKSFFDSIYFYFQRIHFHTMNLLIAEDRVAFLREKFKIANSRKTVWYEMLKSKFINNSYQENNGQKKTIYDLWKTNDQAALNYKPREYAGIITHFGPIKQYAELESSEVGWEGLAAGGVQTHRLPVYPAGMLMEPFVKTLATELKKCIENVLTTRGAKG